MKSSHVVFKEPWFFLMWLLELCHSHLIHISKNFLNISSWYIKVMGWKLALTRSENFVLCGKVFCYLKALLVYLCRCRSLFCFALATGMIHRTESGDDFVEGSKWQHPSSCLTASDLDRNLEVATVKNSIQLLSFFHKLLMTRLEILWKIEIWR